MSATFADIWSTTSISTNTEFYLGIFQGMQENPDDSTSECMDQMTTFTDLIANLQTESASQSNYDTFAAENGVTGSVVGYYIYLIELFNNAMEYFFYAFDQCSISGFINNLGKGVQSASGACDLIVSGLYIYFTDAFTDLNAQSDVFNGTQTDANAKNVGITFGELIARFLDAETPDFSWEDFYFQFWYLHTIISWSKSYHTY